MSSGVEDTQARRELSELRHEVRNYMAVETIKQEAFEREVEEGRNAVTKSIEELKSILKWAGSLIISLIIGVLAWSLVQQYNANEDQKRQLENQIRLLQEQERTRLIAEQNRARLEQVAPTQSQGQPAAPAQVPAAPAR